MLDREAAELQHSIIEAAKQAQKAEPSLTFVQHIEIQARDMCRGGQWQFETRCAAGGVWSLIIEPVSDVEADPGSLL